MEAIGAGASVLQIVGFALQGVKTLYETSRALNNASRETSHLVAAVGKLKDVLDQLQSSRLLQADTARLCVVQDILTACLQDVTIFTLDLAKLQSSSDTGRVQRAWKRVKYTLHEKTLGNVWERINYNCNMLQIQVALLHSDVTLDCEIDLQQVKMGVDTANIHMSAISNRVQDISVSNATQLGNLFTVLNDTTTMQSTQLSHLTTITRNASAINATQYGTTLRLLRNLEVQVSSTELANDGRISKFQPDKWDECNNAMAQPAHVVDYRLTESLSRLLQLQYREAATISGEHADSIIEALELVLAAVIEQQRNNSPMPTGPYASSSTAPLAISTRDLEKLQAYFKSVGAVRIGPNAKRFLPFSGRVIQQRQQLETTLNGAKTNITINKLYEEELTANIKTFTTNYVIIAQVQRLQRRCGTIQLYATISVARTLPIGSKIFTIAKYGTVDALRKFLAAGRGSLEDRDERGTSLFHYAVDTWESCPWRPPDEGVPLCKFLIEHGANVDETCRNPHAEFVLNEYHYICPPLTLLTRHNSMDRAMLRLLLDAGADPTIPSSNGRGRSALDIMEERNASGKQDAVLSAVIMNPIPFVNVKEVDSCGRTKLMHLYFRAFQDATAVDLLWDLLRQGVDVHARDHKGYTCLRYLWRDPTLTESRSDTWKYAAMNVDNALKILEILVREGADVIPWMIKVSRCSDCVYQMGGWRGDIWDAFLSRKGHDIRKIRQAYHRIPEYRDACRRRRGRQPHRKYSYLRHDFELLWKGEEASCHYYNDPHIWCPASTTAAGACPYGGSDWFCPSPNALNEYDFWNKHGTSYFGRSSASRNAFACEYCAGVEQEYEKEERARLQNDDTLDEHYETAEEFDSKEEL